MLDVLLIFPFQPERCLFGKGRDRTYGRLGKEQNFKPEKASNSLTEILKIEMPAPHLVNQGLWLWSPDYVLNAPQIIQMSSQAYETLVGGWSKYWFSVL